MVVLYYADVRYPIHTYLIRKLICRCTRDTDYNTDACIRLFVSKSYREGNSEQKYGEMNFLGIIHSSQYDSKNFS